MPDVPSLPPVRWVVVRALVVVCVGGLAVLGAQRLAAEVFNGGDAGGSPILNHPELLVLAAVIWTVSLIFQAMRWRALVPGRPPGLVVMSLIVVGANVLNLTLPGPTGEVVAAIALHRRWNVPFATALASSLLARVLALAVLGGMLVVLTPWVVFPAPALPFGLLLVGSGAAALVGLCLWPGAVLGWLAGRVERTLLLRRAGWGAGAIGRLPAHLRATGAHLSSLGRLAWTRWAQAAAWSAANTVTLAFAVGLAFGSAGAAPSALGLLEVHLLASLSAVAALVLPGGLGAMDAVYAAAPVLLAGVSPALSVQGALAVREAQLGSLFLSIPAMVWLLRGLAADQRVVLAGPEPS